MLIIHILSLMFKKTTELIENHQQDKTYIFVFTLM